MAIRHTPAYQETIVVVVVVHTGAAGLETPREIATTHGTVVNQGDSLDKGEQSLVEARRQDGNR